VESQSEGILSGIRVGRNFRWSRKEFLVESEGILGAVGVGKNVPTPTSV
jgi:hypothetical protein